MQKRILRAIVASGLALGAPQAHAQGGIPTGCEAAQEGTPQYAKCLRDYNDAVLSSPNFFSYYARGRFYYQQGDDDHAIPDLSQAIAHYGGGGETRQDFVDARFFRGSAYRRENLKDQALDDFAEVVRLKPDYAPAYESRGIIYLNTNRYDLAAADFTKLISLRHDFNSYYNRGLAYDGGGHPDEAIADFTKVIALVPSFAYGYYNRGLAREHKGLKADAITDYQLALGHDANLQPAKDGLARLSADAK